MSSEFHILRADMDAAYAALYAQYQALEELRGTVQDRTASLSPPAASPHMPGVRDAMAQTQRAVDSRLVAQINTVQTKIVAILDGMYQAVSTFGAEDAEAAAALRASMSGASAAYDAAGAVLGGGVGGVVGGTLRAVAY